VRRGCRSLGLFCIGHVLRRSRARAVKPPSARSLRRGSGGCLGGGHTPITSQAPPRAQWPTLRLGGARSRAISSRSSWAQPILRYGVRWLIAACSHSIQTRRVGLRVSMYHSQTRSADSRLNAHFYLKLQLPANAPAGTVARASGRGCSSGENRQRRGQHMRLYGQLAHSRHCRPAQGRVPRTCRASNRPP
jgi:hypothetical protein